MRRIRTSEIRMKFMQIHASKFSCVRALDQHRTNRWQLSRPDDQNEIGPTSFVNVRAKKNFQQNANVGPTNDCYLGMTL